MQAFISGVISLSLTVVDRKREELETNLRGITQKLEKATRERRETNISLSKLKEFYQIIKLTQAKACDYQVAATFRLREKGNSYTINLSSHAQRRFFPELE